MIKNSLQERMPGGRLVIALIQILTLLLLLTNMGEKYLQYAMEFPSTGFILIGNHEQGFGTDIAT